MSVEFIKDYSSIRKKSYFKEFSSKEYLLSSGITFRLTKFVDFIGYLLIKPFIKSDIYMENTKKILVIKNDFLGDVVLSTPFIHQLKNHFSKSEIILGVRDFSKAILEKNKDVDKIVSLNTPWLSRNDSKGYFNMLKFEIANFRKYDLIFDLTTDPRNILLSFFIGKKRVGFTNRGLGFFLNKGVKRNLKNHIVEENLKLLEKLKIKTDKSKTDLNYLVDKKYFSKLNLKKNYLVIHPGVSEKSRDWGVNNFVKLTKILSKKHSVVVVEKDKSMLKKFAGIKNVETIKTNTINELITVIKNSKLLIGLESLSIHLASSLEVKTIDIHSTTTPFWIMGPYNKQKTIIFENSICNHCNKTFCNKNFSINKISVDEVAKVAKNMLE